MKARMPAGFGRPDMNALMRQAQKMQEQMEQITTELEAKEYTAAAGGGAVSATVTGKMEVKNIDIKPEAGPVELKTGINRRHLRRPSWHSAATDTSPAESGKRKPA